MSPKFIAEFTTNHMGNLNVLLRMVENAAWAGCDYIKMQKKDVETFYTNEKLDALFSSPYGKTYRDYRTIFEFDKIAFDIFDQKCKEYEIPWFATVQDVSSLHFMLHYDLDLYKIASSNARNKNFLREVAQNVPKNKTIVISVGGSTLKDIEECLSIIPDHRIYLLHCIAEYPCPPETLRLGNIKVLQERFASDRIAIGYSGHEEGFIPTLAAVDYGVKMVERHFCLSRYSFVHHIGCSLEPEEYKKLIAIVRSGRNLKSLYTELPSTAFQSYFGMSEIEKNFLIEQKYGHKYVGEESEFYEK